MSKSIWQKPWLHFLILGGSLYLFSLWQPPSLELPAITQPQLEQLARNWQNNTGQRPNQSQLAILVRQWENEQLLLQVAVSREFYRYDPVVRQRLLRDMRFMGESGDEQQLFEEALERELHLNDEVVRRRMIQVLEEVVVREHLHSEPAKEELQLWYQQHAELWIQPAQIALDHLFCSECEEPGKAQWHQLQQGELESEELPLEHSDPFLNGYHFTVQSQDQLARYFGQTFAEQMMRLGAEGHDGWQGPVRSPYGLHLVRITDYQEQRQLAYEEVTDKVRYQRQAQRRRELLDQYVEELRRGISG